MGRQCAIKNCKNEHQNDSDISLHRIPGVEEFRQKWLSAVPTDLIQHNIKVIHICSKHFTSDSFQPESFGLTRRMLKKTAVPTLFDHFKPKEVLTSRAVSVQTQTDSNNTYSVAVQTYPKDLKASDKEIELRKKIRTLQKRLQRRETKLTSMNYLMRYLKSEKYIKTCI